MKIWQFSRLRTDKKDISDTYEIPKFSLRT